MTGRGASGPALHRHRQTRRSVRKLNNTRMTVEACKKSPYISQHIMKKFLVGPFASLLLVVCAVLAAPTAANAQHHRRFVEHGGAAGRLIIWRVATLGNDLVVGVRIDGQPVADLTYGKHLDIPVSPGPHTLVVQPYPRVYSDAAVRLTLNVRPGELYNFTAKGGVRQLILSRS
jgi:hypothetical protein